jgi:hypothetical protein
LAYPLQGENFMGIPIAPKEEALARLRGEYGRDEELTDNIVESMKRFYKGVSRGRYNWDFSNNSYLRKLKDGLTANFHAHLKGEVMPFEVHRADLLAQRYCHPKGESNPTIVTLLISMGLVHLLRAPSKDQVALKLAVKTENFNESSSEMDWESVAKALAYTINIRDALDNDAPSDKTFKKDPAKPPADWSFDL